MTAFSNSLQVKDKIWDIELKKFGLVDRQPRGRNVSVIIDGTVTPRYRDVTLLRFVVPGAKVPAEDVPPYEGDLPPLAEKAPKKAVLKIVQPVGDFDPAAPIRDRREAIRVEMETMTQRFTVLRAEDTRLENALKVLSA